MNFFKLIRQFSKLKAHANSIGFSNHRAYPEAGVMHTLNLPKMHPNEQPLGSVFELGRVVTKMFSNLRNKAPRLNFADVVFEGEESWSMLYYVIGSLEVKGNHRE